MKHYEGNLNQHASYVKLIKRAIAIRQKFTDNHEREFEAIFDCATEDLIRKIGKSNIAMRVFQLRAIQRKFRQM